MKKLKNCVKKLKKWQLISLVVGGILLIVWGLMNRPSSNHSVAHYQVATVKKGTIASPILLKGMLTASQEQYVYYDSGQGDLESVLVHVGDQVTVGQPLVKYNQAVAKEAYDAAQRAVQRIDGQLYELKTTASNSLDDNSQEGSLTKQINDLASERIEAVVALNKAKRALDETVVTSTIAGTVVEVNRDVTKSQLSSAQTIVHVVNSGSLQVSGELSEYDLTNISVGQEVKLTSKVYPEKKWTGKVSYLSDYPKNSPATNQENEGASSSKYPFKIDLTSDLDGLKQGFSVNIEVINQAKHSLIPAYSVITKGKKSYVFVLTKGNRLKKVEVVLGNADAEKQEVLEGLSVGDKVVSSPNKQLRDGQEIRDYEKID